MFRLAAGICAIGIAIGCTGLAGCGSDSGTATVNTGTQEGTLLYDPPFRIASLNAADFAAQLGATAAGQSLLAIAQAPTCGVDFYHLEYNTVGGKGEATTASGALLVPTGAAPACSGPRPIVLYAHGTNPNKLTNLADITDTTNTEGALIAAMFAAQGYIVVAPNYAGYDTSSLSYHPFLNGAQQSQDMMDALTAARSALPNTLAAATSDSGKLFVTGYSQGGYVAMATVQALQAAGKTVTASAPMSGPYALEAFGDVIFFGNVDIGSTVFGDMVANSYQSSYGNLYATPTDVYDPAFAASAPGLLPSATPLATLFAGGKLPQLALFNSTTPTGTPIDALLVVPTNNPIGALGFGSPSLINNNYRVAYALDAVQNTDGAVTTPQKPGLPTAASPQDPLRQDLKKNDMRSGWAPNSPMLLCGGEQDPTVFFDINARVMVGYWAAAKVPAQLITLLDINATPPPPPNTALDPFAPLQVAFQQTIAALLASGGEAAVVQSYHTTVAPFCTAAARAFFGQF